MNILEKQKLVHRTYGGVELVEKKGVTLPFRYHKMKSAKARLARVAAELVRDGDTVFLDASTTTEYISHYLVDKKDITVITNNIAMVSFLSDRGVNVICLGGRVVEPPSMLSGEDTVDMAERYNADICFFSTGGFTRDGIIEGSFVYGQLHRVMRRNSKRVWYVADHDKLKDFFSQNLFDFGSVDGVISDYRFEDEVKRKYGECRFVTVEK
ncbi:MAG: DeoR/GlpR transcriptional regulator [Clostridia bacterium]|nr:DeoR/GlpR transcriptional regulator [Clostridia bacterium]